MGYTMSQSTPKVTESKSEFSRFGCWNGVKPFLMSTVLTAARYGKDKIRVFRVVRQGKLHNVVEYNVTTLVEGDIETRYLTFISSFSAMGHSKGCWST